MYKQRTIKKEFSIRGIGIHSGLSSEVIFKPAPANTGIIFIKNRDNRVFIPSCVRNVVDTTNQVTIGVENKRIQTVEHIVSALYGQNISNCIIEVFNREVPIMDGSAYPFVEVIKEAGTVEQCDHNEPIKIPHPIWITEGDKYLVILPSQKREFNFHISFDHPGLKNQSYYLENLEPDLYEREISKARTFGFFKDWASLKKRGLGRGGSLDNAIVYDDKGVMNDELRYENEPVRHKILDLIGDLSLLNKPIIGRVVASKSGHTMDICLVRKIKQLIVENRFTKKDIQENYKKFEKEVGYLL